MRVALSPTAVPDDGPPAVTGPGLQAAVLKALERYRPGGPVLSAWWHDPAEQRKPYALTPLWPADNGYGFEIGILRDTVPPWCAELAWAPLAPVLATALGSEPHLRVGQSTFAIESVTVPQAVSHEQIWATAPDISRWGLQLRSPTVVRAGRTNQPFPVPSLVLGALLLRWSSLITAELADRCPAPVPDILAGLVTVLMAVSDFGGSPAPRLVRLMDIRDQLARASERSEVPRELVPLLELQAGLGRLAGCLQDGVEADEFAIRSESHVVKVGAAPFAGATGTVWFRAAGPLLGDVALRRAVSVLAHFAEFSGLGDMTTSGAGWVVRLPSPGGGPAPAPGRARSASRDQRAKSV